MRGAWMRRLRGSVAALAAAETLVWAGFYYMFPALLLRFERDLGERTEIAGTFTLALLASALAAPVAGRIIDRGHGRMMLAASACGGGLLLIVLASVQTMLQFQLVWLGLGIAMASCLYEPCFAQVTRIRRNDAPRAITRITLIAGFAGAVSFPTANIVAGWGGWRLSALVFAAVILIVAVPLMWQGAAPPDERELPPSASGRRPDDGAEGALGRAAGTATFWLLGAAFTTIALTHGMLITHLLPLLEERAVDPAAAVLAVSLIGPMQVVGRLLMLAAGSRLSIDTVCAVSFVTMIAASSLLLATGSAFGLILLFVVLQGAGYGVTSITRPVLTAERLGRAGFGAISGALAVPFIAAAAAAPALAAVIWSTGGYDLVLVTCIGALIFGLVCLALVLVPGRRGPRGAG